MKNITVTELKQYLKTKSDKELISEIVEIFKIDAKVKEYFSLKVNADYESDLLQHYKDIVENQFFPARGDSVLDYKILRNAVSDFTKIAKNPENIADLLMFYVENGVEFTNSFGDVNETFYNNIANMYNKTIRYIIDNSLEPKFRERCEKAMENSQNIGWGFGIFMEECFVSNFDIDNEEDSD